MSSYLSVIFSNTGAPLYTIYDLVCFFSVFFSYCANAKSYNSGILVMKLSSVKQNNCKNQHSIRKIFQAPKLVWNNFKSLSQL